MNTKENCFCNGIKNSLYSLYLTILREKKAEMCDPENANYKVQITRYKHNLDIFVFSGM